MRNVAQAQRRLVAVIVGLAIIDVVALALLLSPAIHSSKASQAELQSVAAATGGQTRAGHSGARHGQETGGGEGADHQTFMPSDFASRYSEISETLAKAANESHVQLTNITYTPVKPTADEAKTLVDRKLTEINLTLDMTGNYDSEIKFINALERSKLLLVLESVNLAESQGGSIRLSLRMQTYLRTAES